MDPNDTRAGLTSATTWPVAKDATSIFKEVGHSQKAKVHSPPGVSLLGFGVLGLGVCGSGGFSGWAFGVLGGYCEVFWHVA